MRAGQRLQLVLAVTVTAAVLGLVYLQVLTAKRSADRRIGIVLEEVAEGVGIASVAPGLPAERGGLAPGDRLLSIDAVEIREPADYDRAASAFRRSRPVVYRVERDGEQRVHTVLPGTRMPWTSLITGAVTLLGYLALALLTLAQRKRDLRATLLFLYATAVAVELALPSGLVGSLGLAVASAVIFFLLTGLEIGLELHLASSIPDQPRWLRRRPWIVPTYYAVGIGCGLLAAVGAVAEGLGVAWPWESEQATVVLNVAVLPLWSIAVTALLASRLLTHPEPLGRQQAGLVLAGELPWMIFNLVTAPMEALGGGRPAWADMAQPVILLCFPVAVFVAIFRTHLIDIEYAVRRSLLYTSLTGSLVLVFYAAVGAGSAMVSQWVEGGTSVVVLSLATLLLGLLFSPLRGVLQRLIDHRFFPERQAQRERLAALAAELPVFGKVPLMGRHLVAQLEGIFAATSVTLLVAEPRSRVLVTVASTLVNPERDFSHSFLLSPDEPGVETVRRARRPLPAAQLVRTSAGLAQRLRMFQADIVVPVLSHDALVGLLLLGSKRSARGYQAEELELLSLLSHHVGTVFENARLFDSATFDSLTGLPRRENALDHLERELQRALRYSRPLAVGMADLDNFKAINDRYGHLAGDSLLKRVAQELAGSLRSADALGRYGGEEFLLVLPETDLAGAVVVAEKVRRAIEAVRLPLEDGPTISITVSIGLATLDDLGAEEEATARSLIGAADVNLLRAKANGRNRVEPELTVHALEPEPVA